MSHDPREKPLVQVHRTADLESRLARAEARASQLRAVAAETERMASEQDRYALELRAEMAQRASP